MEKFKHIVVANGSLVARKRLVEELYKIGYKKKDDVLLCLTDTSSNYCITMNYKCGFDYHTPHSGILDGFSNEGEYWKRQGVKYQFEIDNENEFQAALAIAAIRDDNEGHIGEIWWYDEDAYQIIENDRTIIGVWWNSYTRHVYGKIAVGIGNWKKATPKEIIKHFKNNKSTNMSNKKIIGYKAPYDIYTEIPAERITKGEMLIKSTTNLYYKKIGGLNSLYYLAKEIVEQWEPVYKEDEITIGDYKAVKEGDLVAFGCQKFDIAELYAYKKLLQGHKENKAEITVMGTKISKEILDRLIEML